MITKMYLLYNVIPLIFGNKQTIEFRIHTPTYDVNKILPFIFMNSLLINFTIKNQELILKNKFFLNNYNLFDIICCQIDNYDIPNLNSFRDLMYDYISMRKNNYEMQLLKGNILGTESEIPSPNYINWSDKKIIKKDHCLTNNNDLLTLIKNIPIDTSTNILNTSNTVFNMSNHLEAFDSLITNLSNIHKSNYIIASDSGSSASSIKLTSTTNLKEKPNDKVPF